MDSSTQSTKVVLCQRDVAGFTPDIEALATRGMAFERLDQLALEHLYGVR